MKKRCAAMNEVRKTIINPQETAGEGMKVNGMTRGMLYGKDFSKAAALCAKIAVPMAVILRSRSRAGWGAFPRRPRAARL